jgi:hypothetical protein
MNLVTSVYVVLLYPPTGGETSHKKVANPKKRIAGMSSRSLG